MSGDERVSSLFLNLFGPLTCASMQPLPGWDERYTNNSASLLSAEYDEYPGDILADAADDN